MASVKVYKASAGSGKTFTLAVQYIYLLITTNPIEYRHTLAVTFTNKATTEMKDRILEQLYGVGNALPSSKNYLKALQKELKENGITISDEEVRKSCREALHYILHDYSRFRIETIDSFFQSVLRNLAHELGLSARLQIDLNDKQILSQAVDNLVDGLGKKTLDAETQKLQQNKAESVTPWIDNYVKDQIENADTWDIRGKIKELSSIIFKEEYMRREETFRERINDEALLKDYRNRLYALLKEADKAIQEVAEYLSETVSRFNRYEEVIASGSWIPEYAKTMLEGKYAEASITDKRLAALDDATDLLKKDYKQDASLKEILQPICDTMKTAEEQRQQYLTLANTINLSLQHINPLRLLNHVEQEVTEITNDSNRFILAKTPILLYRLIEGCDAPFVFEKMGTLFHNVMIDEFQDTSKLQWENFKVLLLESQSAGGSNLLVGDIKQSIYRFRNGDWRILKNIKHELVNSNPQIKTLDTNFRSDTNVIRFNNEFFKEACKLLDVEGEVGTLQQIYSDVKQEWPEDNEERGHVRVMLRTDKKLKNWEEVMLDDMCQQIKQLHNDGLPYKKMCVLMRSRTHVKTLIDYVHTHLEGVKMISDEGFQLASSRTLGILISALHVLCYGKQDLVAERYLVKQYLQMTKGGQTTIQEFATKPMEEVMPCEYTDRMAELKEYPLHELCEELYRILQLDQIKGEDAYVFTFYDELQTYLRNGTSDIQSFLEYWDTDMKQKFIPACEVDGINIVTIHKSKGLQYHTVLMPYCDQPMQDIRHTEMLWCDAKQAPYNAMGSMPINGAGSKFEQSLYVDDYKEEQFQRRIEEMNALYVAFTRAEHNLYVWGGSATGNTLTYSTLLWEAISKKMSIALAETKGDGWNTWSIGQPFIKEEEEEEKKDKKKKEEEKNKNRLAPEFTDIDIKFRSYNRTMDFRQSNEASLYIRQQGDDYEEQHDVTADGLTYIEQGKLLHEIFSSIERIDQLDNTLQAYLDKAILKDQKQLQRIKRLVQRGMQKPEVQQWFDGHLEVKNECEILHIDPDTGQTVARRPDRVMFSDDEIIVVDFKFGRPNPDDYIPQVQTYMELIQQMYPEKRVRGYLWYVYQNNIEEVKACF